MKIRIGQTLARWAGIRRVRHHIKSESAAAKVSVGQATAEIYTVWEEPNRANSPELHIGKSGGRYSTLTGVWWLDDQSFIVNHRSGLRMAVFDAKDAREPVWKGEIGNLTDDIAARRIDGRTWDIAVSGCWSNILTRYRLTRSEAFELQELDVLPHTARDFCHGVAYDAKGELCYSIHTGKDPRLFIAGKVHRLPYPWGVRDLCHDATRKRYLAVAVSTNPRKKAYGSVKTSLWSCPEGGTDWTCLGAYDNVHSDALDVWSDHIWMPDQVGNRLLAIDARTGDLCLIGAGDGLDFPHGLGISPGGKIAVTNYGSSSVVVVDADGLLALGQVKPVQASCSGSSFKTETAPDR